MEINLKGKIPDVRTLNDMRDVLCDQEWADRAPNLQLYFMYRGLEEKDGVRYDITTIPAQMLGKEFNKTKGHIHIGSYPEIYTVLEGEGIYLMQKQIKDIIEDVFAVKAKKGDYIIIPPFYAHVTINSSKKEDLKMANWMDADAKSDYSSILEKKGACYFYTLEGWVKNSNYLEVPKLRFEEPKKELPEDLTFLKG
ncbi:glucose-6-phosphate isomerase [Patescibacteria group bacterium]|nr:glucose-6-phosphate isomerase [Patescibacteria group bacterium]